MSIKFPIGITSLQTFECEILDMMNYTEYKFTPKNNLYFRSIVVHN